MDENQISYEEIDREIEERKKEKLQKLPHSIFDAVELIAITLAVLLLVTSFLFRLSVVSGGSMSHTLEGGDRLLISDLLYTPKNGDIVVLQMPDEITERYSQLEKGEAIIKRVIAVGGQTVEIKDSVVYVDGQALREPYVLLDDMDSKANMKPITVSDGCVFVLGDHRSNSLDSRYFGEVDADIIIGKVLLRLMPFSSFGSVR